MVRNIAADEYDTLQTQREKAAASEACTTELEVTVRKALEALPVPDRTIHILSTSRVTGFPK
jgi:hypothetical protein